MTPSSVYAIPLHISLLLAGIIFLCGLACAYLISGNRDVVVDDRRGTAWLDGLRGFAALIVCLNHAPLVLFNLHVAAKYFSYTPEETKIFQVFGALGVQIFFCITGMLFAGKVASAKSVDWTDFFVRRVRRIVPAYFVASSLALVCIVWFTWPITQPAGEFLSALPSLFSFNLIWHEPINGFSFDRLMGVSWTLMVEWYFYVLLPFIFIFIRRFSSRAAFAVLLALAVASLITTQDCSWAFLLSGAFCERLMNQQFNPRVKRLAYAAMGASAAVFVLMSVNLPSYGIAQWLIIMVFFASVVIAKPKLLSARLFTSMGEISYSFYLLHVMTLFFIFAAWNRYISDVTQLSFGRYSALAIAGIGIAIALSKASYLWVERPFMSARASGAKTTDDETVTGALPNL